MRWKYMSINSTTVQQSICADLTEIFSGIQGEGILVGVRQIFVRFHGCHLDCRYCDTPASRQAASAGCRIERAAGSREIETRANPLDVDDILAAVNRLQQGYPHHSVALTGGEPLLRREMLDALLPRLHATGLPSYLETNGMLAAEMAALATPPHFLATDIKLPTATGLAPCWEAQAAFLAVAVAQFSHAWGESDVPRRIQVKIVFTEDSLAEIEHAAALIAACRPDLPCVLQPVTPRPAGPSAPPPATVLEAQRRSARHLRDVRVIPQTHVMLGQW